MAIDLSRYYPLLKEAQLVRVRGRVTELTGLVIKASVPGVRVGEVVDIKGAHQLRGEGRGGGFPGRRGDADAPGRAAGHRPRQRGDPHRQAAHHQVRRGAARPRARRHRRAHRRQAAAGRHDRLVGGPRLPGPLHAPAHRTAAAAGRALHRRAAHRGRGPAHRPLRRLRRRQVHADGPDRPEHPGGAQRRSR